MLKSFELDCNLVLACCPLQNGCEYDSEGACLILTTLTDAKHHSSVGQTGDTESGVAWPSDHHTCRIAEMLLRRARQFAGTQSTQAVSRTAKYHIEISIARAWIEMWGMQSVRTNGLSLSCRWLWDVGCESHKIV